MKLIALESENVKRIKAIRIEPKGNVFNIGGDTDQGKSSLLDSIIYAFCGEKSIPPKPIRKGCKSARIMADLGEMIVTRTFVRRDDDTFTTKLEIKSKDGAVYKSPQAILENLYGKVAFDPLEWMRLKPKDQLEMLKQLVGLDFSAEDNRRANRFSERTEINRQLKAKQSELAACPKIDGAPEAEVSVAELMEELKHSQAANADNQSRRDALEQEEETQEQFLIERVEAADNVERLKRELAEAEDQLAAATKRVNENETRLDGIRLTFGALIDDDVSVLETKISEADSVNSKVRQNKQHAALEAQCSHLEKQSAELTAVIENIDKYKSDAMAKAKFPVAGLGFDENGVTFNGLPFEQSGSAVKIKTSVAMGFAIHPKLPLALIRDGSLLGEADLEIVSQIAAECDPDAQVLIERVSKGAECSIIIEDGSIVGIEQKAELQTNGAN